MPSMPAFKSINLSVIEDDPANLAVEARLVGKDEHENPLAMTIQLLGEKVRIEGMTAQGLQDYILSQIAIAGTRRFVPQ